MYISCNVILTQPFPFTADNFINNLKRGEVYHFSKSYDFIAIDIYMHNKRQFAHYLYTYFYKLLLISTT